MTCAKTQVFVTLTHSDGRQWTGTNWCRNPQTACPRAPGEDYTKCKTICDQFGHAEVDALRLAGPDAAGCTASVKGHTYYCMPCQHALFGAGVVSLSRPAIARQGVDMTRNIIAYEFYNRANGHVIVDFTEHTHAGHLTKEKGYAKRALVYATDVEEAAANMLKNAPTSGMDLS